MPKIAHVMIMVLTVGLLGGMESAYRNARYFPCQWKLQTGFPCPTCGLTRSMLALRVGDFEQSVRIHPGGIVLLTILLFQIPLRTALVISDRKHPCLDIIIHALALSILYFVLNQIPGTEKPVRGTISPGTGFVSKTQRATL